MKTNSEKAHVLKNISSMYFTKIFLVKALLNDAYVPIYTYNIYFFSNVLLLSIFVTILEDVSLFL